MERAFLEPTRAVWRVVATTGTTLAIHLCLDLPAEMRQGGGGYAASERMERGDTGCARCDGWVVGKEAAGGMS